MKIIGITGGSGTGKSTVAKYLAEMGGYVIDADKIARLVIKKDESAYNETVEHFGSEILSVDGEIDRKKLGNIVFNDQNSLETLNAITHKYILNYINKEISRITENPDTFQFIVIDAPLLIQTGLNMICDSVWVVDSDYGVRVQRVMNRDNISENDTKARFSSQMDFEEARLYADVVIKNNFDNERDFYQYLKSVPLS